MFLRRLFLAAAPAALTVPLCARPQEPPAQEPPPPKGSLEDLERRIEALKTLHEREIAELRDQIDKLEEDAAAARLQAQAPSQQALSVFNPAITVFANFLYRNDDRPVYV